MSIADDLMAEMGLGPDPSEGYAEPAVEVEAVDEPQGTSLSPADAEEPVSYQEFDEELSEAELRLAKAALYRQFLSGPLFDGDSEIIRQVEKEFRDFARQCMARLLGVQEGSSESSPHKLFTDDEVTVLKAVVKKMVQTVSTKKTNTASARVEVRQPASPPVQKKNEKSEKNAGLRVRPAPEGVLKRGRPAHDSPGLTRRPPAPAQTPQPHRPPQVRTMAPQAAPPTPPKNPPWTSATVPEDQTLLEENGRKYRIRWRQIPSSNFGPAAERILEKLQPDQAVLLPNGVWVKKTVGEELYSIIKQDLTPEPSSSARIPMPDKAGMEAMTALQTARAVSLLPATAQQRASLLLR